MIFILCAVVLVTGFVLALYIKREGERSYARHQRMTRQIALSEQMERLTKATIDFRIVLVDKFTPALQKATADIQRMTDALSKGGQS